MSLLRFLVMTATAVGGSMTFCYGLYWIVMPDLFGNPIAVTLPALTPLLVAPPLIYFTDRIREQLRQQNLELEAARNRAEEADRRKSEFLTVISHEVRTPLTSIKVGLGLLRRDLPEDAGDEVTNLVDVAYRNCLRLEDLINDTLDLQKIEAGAMPLARPIGRARPAGRRGDGEPDLWRGLQRDLLNRGPGARACGRRRSAAPDAGVLEPAVQRGQVFVAGCHGRADGATA